MANKCDVTKKVMRLKLRLTDEAHSATVLKTLHKLKDMDITEDILSETGIGEIVNSLRRHKQVGEFAKSLVKSWKNKMPKQSRSQTEDENLLESMSVQDKLNDKNCPSNGTFPTEDLNNNQITSCKSLKKNDFLALDRRPRSEKYSKGSSGRHRSHKDRYEKCHTENTQIIHEDDKKQKSKSDLKGKAKSSRNRGNVGSAKESHRKSRTSKSSKGSAESLSFDTGGKNSKTLKLVSVTDDRSAVRPKSSEAKNKKRKERIEEKQSVLGFAQESDCMESSKRKNKKAKAKHEDQQSDCDREEPSMSFESYLNYDKNVSKRTERLATKKWKEGKDRAPYMRTLKSTLISCTASVKPGSVMDLLNTPLPADLLQCERSSNVEANTFEKKVEREPGSCDVPEEPAVFPGQRLNKKMQVYSGAKTTSLPTMMSLHQQCIRTLQNNINLLYDTGGVPFEILEPVLERCTPEQLLRIEEYNPIYVGVTDHLWGKHCKREFKGSRLLEYESWKEMYIRLSEEREIKLQRVTKSIVSAHSNKPKGRQVKMAFIHTVAKPPRDVRIQQEIHGTAAQQPSQGRYSVKAPSSNRLRPTCPEPSRSNNTSPASGNTQDLRKKSSVAPMMAKSLKAFKKQMGRR